MDDRVDYSAFPDFSAAADEIMVSMRALIGLEHWLVTRIKGDDWVVLRTHGKGPWSVGDALKYSSTICSHMIAGNGPNIVNDVARNVSYASALIRQTYEIGSYAGAPLLVNGEVYGVLCAIDPAAQGPDNPVHARLIQTSARTLSTLLTHELANEELLRRVERAESEALVDEPTGLFNRRGWDRLIERESIRAQRYGNQATMFVMDIDGLKEINDAYGHGAGDALIKNVADVIGSVMRENDIAARLGGDEFGVLAVETSALDAQVLHDRFDHAFSDAGIGVAIGRAHCNRPGGIMASLSYADELMYAQKAHRHKKRA